MEILNLMTRDHDGQSVNRLATHFEMSAPDLARVLDYVVPMFEDALTRLMAHPQGLAAILAQLASGQYQRDLHASDLFQNSRILANGTGILSLLLRNEATIRVISFVAAEGSRVDAAIIRRMMPYIATLYISALARRSNEPLRALAARFTNSVVDSDHSTYRLAELVLSKSPLQKAAPQNQRNKGSIKDILNTLSKIEMDEDTGGHHLKR